MWQIARKEIIHNVLGMRFALGTLLSVSLMGVVGYVLLVEFSARQQDYIAAVQRHEESLANTKVYSKVSVTVDFPPSPLSMFGQGVRDLPSSVKVTAYGVPTWTEGVGGAGLSIWNNSKRPYNPLLRVFTQIDLSFVVRIVLSLFALLLVFDSYSGEREGGTLPMVLACPVRRLEVLAGKLLGALGTISLPLTCGILVVLAQWSLSGEVRLDGSVWKGLALVYLASLVYLTAFLGLATWLSLRARDSSMALMTALLVWIVVAVAIPEGVGYLADYGRPRDVRRQVGESVEADSKQYRDRFHQLQEQYPQKSGYWGRSGGGMSGGETILGTSREEVYNHLEFVTQAEPIKFELAEARYRLNERYERALQEWDRWRRRLLRLSPCSVYDNVTVATAGTGLDSYAAVMAQSRRYRDALMEYLRPRTREAAWFTRLLEHPEMETTKVNRERWHQLQERDGDDALWQVLTWDNVEPLDLSAMPRPVVERPNLEQRLRGAVVDLLLLVALTAAVLVLAGRRALRAPIL